MDPYALRILFIGAGSQGHAYAEPITRLQLGRVVAICEPISWKRGDFRRRYIWGSDVSPLPHEEFEDWKDFIGYEKKRRERVKAGEIRDGDVEFKGVDAVFVCVLDELHVHVVKALAPLGLHIMCEKPLATSLHDCIDIQQTLKREWEVLGRQTIFGVGHVLRYSPHNMLLRKLVREDKVIGDVVSVEHTEPIGWWHMAHSFVRQVIVTFIYYSFLLLIGTRGNWRRQDMTAPSLLTKSCHDIDFLMWLLCSPSSEPGDTPHLPSFISSTGSLNQFRKARKPRAAGSATNCLSCPIESTCLYSSKTIYLPMLPDPEDREWPLKSVVPDIEDLEDLGRATAEKRLLEVLAEDYTSETPDPEVKQRSWYGRCVWECDNDVCDDQIVTLTWEDDPVPALNGVEFAAAKSRTADVGALDGRGAKTAVFHMIAPTEKICERRGRVYGTTGEITYDSKTISVHSFTSGKTTQHTPGVAGRGHGGGDESMAEKFCQAVQAVNSGHMAATIAQRHFLGCDIAEIVRSHLVVFAAEIARLGRVVVDWKQFLEDTVVV